MFFVAFFNLKHGRMKTMKTVLITGGNKGIGYAFAKCFAKDHYRLLLVGRNETLLKQASYFLQQEYGVEVLIYAVDLTMEGAVSNLLETIEKQGIKIDVLVNNAGRGINGPLFENDVNTIEETINLNCNVVSKMSTLVSKQMIQQGSGQIINIGSTGAFQPGPYIANYYATKAFIHSYTQAIRQELKEYGIDVKEVMFGPVQTDFYQTSGVEVSPYAMDVEKAVKIAYRKLQTKKACIVVGFSNQVLRFLPTRLKMKSVERMKRKSYGKTFDRRS